MENNFSSQQQRHQMDLKMPPTLERSESMMMQDEVQTDKLSELTPKQPFQDTPPKHQSRLSNTQASLEQIQPANITMSNIGTALPQLPNTTPGMSIADEDVHAALQVGTQQDEDQINVIDYNKHMDSFGSLPEQKFDPQILTVTDDGTMQITHGDLQFQDPRSAITTKQQAKGKAKKKPTAKGPSLRYVVKEELNSPGTGTKNTNEDLVSFTMAPFSAGKDTDDDITVIRENSKERDVSKPKRKETIKQKIKKRLSSKKIKKDGSARRLDEHLLSPFETGRDPSHIGQHLDSFSISGEFVHHLEMESNQQPFELQTITNLDSFSKKMEGREPEWPADLNKAHDKVMANRVPTNKPPKIIGLPDIDICQGKEPEFLNLKINPQTARLMAHQEKLDDIQFSRDAAHRLANPKFKTNKKRRSKSPKKKKQKHLTVEYSSEKPKEEDVDTSFIRNVLGKYIYDFDEHKRRQRSQAMSQSIDVNANNSPLQLPPLMSPQGNRTRQTLAQQLPKFVAQVKKVTQPFTPAPRMAQSIDFNKYRGAAFDRLKLDELTKVQSLEASQADYEWGQALSLKYNQTNKHENDAQVFLTQEFKDRITQMQSKQNEQMTDFDQYFEVMTDLERSPFVPSHIAKARRIKAKDDKELAEEAQIRDKWERKQAKQIESREKEAQDKRQTNTLLEHSISIDNVDSLENRISVGDLMAVGDLAEGTGTSDSYIKNINQTTLDVDLSNFRLSQTIEEDGDNPIVLPNQKTQVQQKKKPKTRQQADINLDERHIEANKALEEGDLATYSKLQRAIKRFPKGTISPQLKNMPKVLFSDAGAPEENAQIDPEKDAITFAKILDDSDHEMEDDEVKEQLADVKQEILEKRIQDKAENFNKAVLGESLIVIKQTNKRLEKASLATLNELIDNYLSSEEPNADFSPLLQVYDQLQKNCNLTLPSKSMLQQDQVFFKAAIAKMRLAHKQELKWVRTEALKTAREYVNKKNYEISQILTKQIRDMYRQYSKLREDALFFKNETARLTKKLVGYEDNIAELANYVRNFQAQNESHARAIMFLDEDSADCKEHNLKRKTKSTVRKETTKPMPNERGGPYNFNPLLKRESQTISQESSLLTLPAYASSSGACSMRHFVRLQNKFLEKIQQFDLNNVEKVHYSKDGIRLPGKIQRTSVEEKVMDMLKTPSQKNPSHVTIDRLSSSFLHANTMNIQEKSSAMSMYQNSQAQNSIPEEQSSGRGSSLESEQERAIAIKKKKKEEREGDPLLRGAFNFFNSHIKVNQEDKIPILKDSVVNYYQGKQIELEENCGILESENKYFKERNAKLHVQNIVCKEKVKELHQRIKHHLVSSQKENLDALNAERKKYEDLVKTSTAALNECKQIFSLEVHVLEKVIERALSDNKEKTNLLRRFAFVLKVPRMHHEYLERNGVDPFIEKFTKLISENKALKDELDRIGENRRVRRAMSLVKDKQRKDNHSMFTNSLPMQVELLIKQRTKYLGKALEEVKLDAQQFKPHLQKKLQSKQRRVNTQLSKSMSIDPSSFKVETADVHDDPFNASRMVDNDSVFSTKRVNVSVPKIVEESAGRLNVNQSAALLNNKHAGGSMTSRHFQQYESQEFNLQQDTSMTKIMGETNKANLKEYIKETIRKRPDYIPKDSQLNLNSQTNFMNNSSKNKNEQTTDTQSKTILHQAYLQALSQSSSMQQIVKKDYLPGNILARSDANLAQTRENFLSQYELVNAYQGGNELPSYKFALSTNVIDSVNKVLNNAGSKKDFLLNGFNGDQAIDTHRILPGINETSQVSLMNDSFTGVSSRSNPKKDKLNQSNYASQKRFYQQVGMKDPATK